MSVSVIGSNTAHVVCPAPHEQQGEGSLNAVPTNTERLNRPCRRCSKSAGSAVRHGRPGADQSTS